MAIRFSCRNCGKSYTYKNRQKGLEFSCRKCRMPLTVPEESHPDKPQSQKKKKKRPSKKSDAPKKTPQLAGVARGINFQLYSIIGQLLGVFSIAMASVMGGPALATLGGVTLLASALTGIAGKFLCLSAPTTTRIGGLTVFSLMLELLGLGIAVVGLAARLPEPLTSSPPLFAAGASILFLFALRRLARYLNNQECVQLANSVVNLLMIGFCSLFGALLGFVFLPLGYAAICISLIIFLVASLRYVSLIDKTRLAVRKRL